MSHVSSEQPALKPAASQDQLSASEPWNLVADGHTETTMLVFEQFADETIAASKTRPNATALDVACDLGMIALRPAQQHPLNL